MTTAIIYLDPTSSLNLQGQIRQKLVEAILNDTFPVGRRLPSSRKLADQLKVARNTVVLAYQQLIDEGYLISRERSGLYVNEKILERRVGFDGRTRAPRPESPFWLSRLKTSVPREQEFSCPQNWQQYPYPFIECQFDQSLYPIKEWREANRLALGVRDINEWAGETGDLDDPMLIDEIRKKILPRRGIQATPDEILITVGTQQALHLVVELLVDSTVPVAMEEPGYPGMRHLLERRGAPLVYQPLDAQGLIVDGRLDQCKVVYVTPSHQAPTAVTMSMERREALLEKAASHNMLIIEDDFDSESNYLGNPHPALKSIDTGGRVIYMSCLSKVLSPGLRLGFMVAPPELIEAARYLRRLTVRHPPLNNQRTAAYFLALGHYDTFLMHLHATFRERWIALRRALNYYLLHHVVMTPAQGGSSFWVRGPSDVDVDFVVKEAARRGVLIEPVKDYYATSNVPENCFRMGITSIPHERIREGVLQLRDIFYDLTENKIENFNTSKGEHITGPALQATIAGSTMLSLIAYGDPCTIELRADGTMLGKAGYADEDCDTGTWWISAGKWCRRWSRWAWGEAFEYNIVMDGEVIKLFDEEGRLIERAILRKSGPEAAADRDLD